MKLFLFALALAAPNAFAFPEMVRHHYVNCNACHVNPNGGGLLTEYGRGMSGEVLSTWQYENESLFLHGLVKPGKMPSFLNVGGDVRALQLHHESAQVREGRYILMQSRLEAAVTVGRITGDIAYFAPDALNHVHGELAHYYLLGNVTDSVQVKAGRFLPAFGINDPHHILSTRQPLGLGFGMERDAIEAHYSGEQWHAALGWSVSRPQSQVRERERAASGQVEKFFSDSYRVGVSLWKGESDARRRWMASAHAILGFTERLYLSDETAWQNDQAKTRGILSDSTVTGVYHFDRLGYEVLPGLHVTALETIAQTDVSNPASLQVMLGGGPVWYPRPHLELELTFTQRKVLKTSREWDDYAWIMAHYYL